MHVYSLCDVIVYVLHRKTEMKVRTVCTVRARVCVCVWECVFVKSLINPRWFEPVSLTGSAAEIAQ